MSPCGVSVRSGVSVGGVGWSPAVPRVGRVYRVALRGIKRGWPTPSRSDPAFVLAPGAAGGGKGAVWRG